MTQDVVVYGAPLMRNLATRGSPIVIVHGSEVPSALDLDRDRFIDFALLLGTDFSQRIKHVGPQRALKFIREHGSIEEDQSAECHLTVPKIMSLKWLPRIHAVHVQSLRTETTDGPLCYDS